ncbi:MAG: hypothetical protein LUJ25_07190 [Firmicutes bacterium]|nr:hypothetical protein [Bacillota bacterium]
MKEEDKDVESKDSEDRKKSDERGERRYEKLEFQGLGRLPDEDGGGGGTIKDTKLYKWLDNFWYHYKWGVIVVTFFAVILGICVFQYSSREVPDVYVMYAGPQYLSSGATTRFKESLRSVTEDYNGDGETGITLVTLVCVSDDEIAEMKAEAEENGEEFYLDASANSQNIKQFSMEIFAGESVVCMLDPWLYESVKSEGGFMELTEIFTEEELFGLELYDECGIYLSSTKFYKYYSSVSVLPEDTVLCIRNISTISVFKGKAKYERLHEYHESMFRNLVLFEYPVGYTETDPSETEAPTGGDVTETEDAASVKSKLFTA